MSCAGAALGQGRAIDWPFFGGDAQRSGWQKSDLRITKENAKDFELVMKRKLEDKGGEGSLTPPVVIGNLISYRGFKELAFVTGSSGRIWSVDADINRVFWEKQLDSKVSGCAGGAMATPTLTPPPNFARPAPVRTPAASKSPGAPPSPAATPVASGKQSVLGSTGFGAPRPAFAVSKDGRLHVLNTSTGEDVVAPLTFLPANMRASPLTIVDGVLYTAVTNCAGKSGSVWAMDLNLDEPKAVSAPLRTPAAGLAALAFGSDDTVYVSGTDGSLVALAPKTLAETGRFAGSGKAVTATPLVFSYEDRDMVAAASGDGRLMLLDAGSPSKAIAETPRVGVVWGGIATWLDSDGVRWIAAPVWGPANPELKFAVTNGTARSGSVVAFKIEDVHGVAVLTPAWISRDIEAPEPPVITSGTVFTVGAGKRNGGGHAVLYAFDAATGKEVYSSGDQVAGPANLNGLTIANGRVFFTTVDGTLYGFGIHLEI